MRVSVCRVQRLEGGRAGVPVELSSLSSTEMHQVSKKKTKTLSNVITLGCFGSPGVGHALGLFYVNVVKDTRRE